MLWILFAFGSAFFAGITAVLAKIGIEHINSTLATAVRTVVVLAFSWLMVFVVGSQNTIGQITGKTLLFLILSGLSTGASWLCYFKALQLGDVNKVAPIDKSSTVLTILLAFLFLGEPISLPQILGVLGIGIGTLLMISKKEVDQEKPQSKSWLLFALLSAVFASLTSIFGKMGVENVESNLGTAIRTIVVLAMAWAMVFVTGEQKDLGKIDRKSAFFLLLSGITTGLSWLCYYRALQDGLASVVVPIDKLSILVTIVFSGLVLKEKLSRKAGMGLVLILAGTGAMLL
ncbi:EamA family transporter [Acutalibacter sp. LFL-21]|uniref:EamA family transporter n=1 Tax=Acutalibacter sp. LFL-21 TaxID=2983399 RepID=UPI0021D67C96|nr:EamA family transporter [Acutalibacter sp. LFL-21]MCU7652873.1 EamA family transporter [Acutalibacter sp. LFL-21]